MACSFYCLGDKYMEWINVNEKYLDFLRAFEGRIPHTDYGTDKYKPFFGKVQICTAVVTLRLFNDFIAHYISVFHFLWRNYGQFDESVDLLITVIRL